MTTQIGLHGVPEEGHMPSRMLSLVAAALFVVPRSVLGQAEAVRRYQFNVDVGLLDLGVGYAERLGAGPLSLGVGLWAAWEAPETFDRHFFEARGLEPFLRYQRTRSAQVEVGPSFLRYATGDDCSACGATFLGVRVAALVGGRRFLFGPAIRYGVVTGESTPTETGFVATVSLRVFLDWER